MTTTAEPTVQFLNTIELESVEASKIEKVSLYSGRAEVTRSYKLDIKTGQNQVKITGLPRVLDDDSLRVEGRGAATIQGVTIVNKTTPPPATTSEALQALEKSKQVTDRALNRCKKAIASLESYLATLKADEVGGVAAWDLLDGYEAQGEKLDARLLTLEAEAKKINEDIQKEKKSLVAGYKVDDKLTKIATIDLFADVEASVTLVLIYAVYQANWDAVYDIRVQMDATKEPVQLVYKAAITQTTGESWNDISLTLETVTPTFGVELPDLQPWRISARRPPAGAVKSKTLFGSVSRGGGGAPVPNDDSDEDMGFALESMEIAVSSSMVRRQTVVTNKGNLSTSFQVPGLVTVPSSSDSQSVTIVQLGLEATMHWLTIPRAEAKVHLKAKIKNASEFPLLPGTASIYVDGSFISKTQVPASNPQESFDCPLGPDPSVRVTYHPLSKKLTESGFYSKHFSRLFTQQITIHNTKTTAINDLTIIDHIPVSEDSDITVKLVEPGLTPPPNPPSLVSSKSTLGKVEKPPTVTVSKGVTANWDGADDPECDVRALGRYGRIAWKCAIPEQGKTNVNLVWEVNTASKLPITGL
ncbi:hypothetical protein ONZ45_g3932 [Pleurotus djamor]|nr:hypothetical protein ONZ45_g3932 [Pleurotus djamor]